MCGRGFAYPSELRAHELKHEKGQENVCVECGLDFPTLAQLKRHLTVHRGPTLYRWVQNPSKRYLWCCLVYKKKFFKAPSSTLYFVDSVTRLLAMEKHLSLKFYAINIWRWRYAAYRKWSLLWRPVGGSIKCWQRLVCWKFIRRTRLRRKQPPSIAKKRNAELNEAAANFTSVFGSVTNTNWTNLLTSSAAIAKTTSLWGEICPYRQNTFLKQGRKLTSLVTTSSSVPWLARVKF